MNYAQKLEQWNELSYAGKVEHRASMETNIVQWQTMSYFEKVQFLANKRKGL